MGDKKSGKSESTAIHCRVKGCKHSPSKFDFCAEHFDQFKFGLVNKHGEPCMDFDKKSEQYDHWKKSRKHA